jgi:Transposase IS116/IS110/IS902 family
VLARTAAINQLRALIVAAPEPLRANLRGLSFAELVTRCARLRPSARDATSRASALALRSTARRIQALSTEARQLTREITQLVDSIAPELLAEPGVGPISAARILIAWSHRGRFRSEAAFAMLAGASPIPASSGQTVRHRLNRGGDRQLNRALHTIALSRRATHRPTRDYIDRRIRDGKTTRDINRCLKRYLARHLPQSRALPADPQTRIGTRPYLPLKRAPRPRPVTLAQPLQHPQTTQLTRRPATNQPRPQPPEAGHLGAGSYRRRPTGRPIRVWGAETRSHPLERRDLEQAGLCSWTPRPVRFLNVPNWSPQQRRHPVLSLARTGRHSLQVAQSARMKASGT